MADDEFYEWAKKRGISSTKISFSHFKETGRGIIATDTILRGETLISIPIDCMITLETVLKSELRPIILNNLACFNEHPIKMLCLYLLFERSKGANSNWHLYINTLPVNFTTTVSWNNDDILLLQDKLLIKKTMSRISLVDSLYNEILPVIRAHPKLFPIDIFTLCNFKWAWSCFMTRSVFYDSNYVLDYAIDLDSSLLSAKFRKRNNYAMIPLLDGLNHTNIEVDGFFDKKTKRYNIVTHDNWDKGQQVFICYGNHSNSTLLIEYGFILPNNIHNCIRLKNVNTLFPELKANISKVKEQWLIENNLFPDGNTKHNYYLSNEGVSWNLQSLLRIVMAADSDLNNFESVFMDQPCSPQSEKQYWQTMLTFVENYLKEFDTSMEDDKQLLQNKSCKYEHFLAISVRLEIKETLHFIKQLCENGIK